MNMWVTMRRLTELTMRHNNNNIHCLFVSIAQKHTHTLSVVNCTPFSHHLNHPFSPFSLHHRHIHSHNGVNNIGNNSVNYSGNSNCTSGTSGTSYSNSNGSIHDIIALTKSGQYPRVVSIWETHAIRANRDNKKVLLSDDKVLLSDDKKVLLSDNEEEDQRIKYAVMLSYAKSKSGSDNYSKKRDLQQVKTLAKELIAKGTTHDIASLVLSAACDKDQLLEVEGWLYQRVNAQLLQKPIELVQHLQSRKHLYTANASDDELTQLMVIQPWSPIDWVSISKLYKNRQYSPIVTAIADHLSNSVESTSSRIVAPEEQNDSVSLEQITHQQAIILVSVEAIKTLFRVSQIESAVKILPQLELDQKMQVLASLVRVLPSSLTGPAGQQTVKATLQMAMDLVEVNIADTKQHAPLRKLLDAVTVTLLKLGQLDASKAFLNRVFALESAKKDSTIESLVSFATLANVVEASARAGQFADAQSYHKHLEQTGISSSAGDVSMRRYFVVQLTRSYQSLCSAYITHQKWLELSSFVSQHGSVANANGN